MDRVKRVGLRPCEATESDARLLWGWSHDLRCRADDHVTHDVTWEEYRRRYFETVRNPDCLLLLATVTAEPCGWLRFDKLAATAARIYIELPPAHRGQGLAVPILAQSLGVVARHWPGLLRLHAAIRNGHFAAVRTFERAGFEFAGPCVDLDGPQPGTEGPDAEEPNPFPVSLTAANLEGVGFIEPGSTVVDIEGANLEGPAPEESSDLPQDCAPPGAALWVYELPRPVPGESAADPGERGLE